MPPEVEALAPAPLAHAPLAPASLAHAPLARISPVIVAGSLYLFYYMALGAYLPFINLYYERLGLNGKQIGTLAALPVLVTTSTSFAWSALADARHWHRRILGLAVVMAPLGVLIIAQAGQYQYPVLVFGVLLYALFNGPIVPLLDGAALEAGRLAGRPYGAMRVWGTVGWLISTLVVGALIERFDIRWLFYAYLTLSVFIWLPVRFQRRLPARVQPGRSWCRDMRELLRPNFVIFLVSLFFISAATGGAQSFFSLYMDRLGAPESLIGLSWSLSALSEIPVVALSGWLLRIFGTRGLLAFSFAMYAVRWLLYSFIHDPAAALAAQLLHGLSFAPFLVAGVTYIDEHTPFGLRTTGLTLFNVMNYGLASIAGSLLAGFLYDAVGVWLLYRVLSALALVGLAIFLVSRPPQPEPGR